MIVNNNLSVIPFYESLEEQDFRKWYAYGNVYPLIVSRHTLVPFYYILPSSATSIKNVKLYRLCGHNDGHSISGDFNSDFNIDFLRNKDKDPFYWKKIFEQSGLSINSVDSYNVLNYVGGLSVDLNLDLGYIYMEISFNDGSVIYSDVFNVVSDEYLSKCIKISALNYNDVNYDGGVIPFTSLFFEYELYLDTDIGMPSYEFEEEGEERLGKFFPIKRVSYKKFKFSFIAPEYLCDVVRVFPLLDYVLVTDRFGRTYYLTGFLMDADWLEQGHYANVKCEFTTQTILKATGNSYYV